MRYIDADKIIYTWLIDNDGKEHDGVTLQSVIDKMPTADVVEVVRCKDCKWWKPFNDKMGHCGIDMRGKDQYCDRGTRADE